MNNDKYQQILKVLEFNDTLCTDDKIDREVLAKALLSELFPAINDNQKIDYL